MLGDEWGWQETKKKVILYALGVGEECNRTFDDLEDPHLLIKEYNFTVCYSWFWGIVDPSLDHFLLFFRVSGVH